MGDPVLKRKTTYRKFRGKDTAPVLLKEDSDQRLASRAATSSGLEPYAGEWGPLQAAHLLKRCSFGIKESEVQQLLSLGMNNAVDLLTAPNPNQVLPVNDYYEYEEDPHAAPGETWVNKPHGEEAEFLRVISLKNWILQSYLKSSLSIHEKMVFFWHNLIPTQFFQIEFANLSYAYYKILDNNALGNFRDIIKQITVDPSMLHYLNGAYNVKEAPDENYARELQELFTVGKGPNSNYTEQDVFEAARILTGWAIDVEAAFFDGEAVSYFEDVHHDEGDKTFSSFYGNKVITGRSGQAGMEETDELIQMILDTNEAALYICRRLYNFFVYHAIDENVETNIIEPLAEIFRSNDYDILPVVQALLKSEHFYDVANVGAYVKNPLDHTLAMMRAFDIPLQENPTERFDFLYQIYYFMHEIGLGIGDPPSVSGWQAYYQQPNYDKIWINADTLINRVQVQDYFVFVLMDLPQFVSNFSDPGDPNQLITDCNFLFQGITLDENVRNNLKANLLAGQQTDDYWTNAWIRYQNNPEDEGYRSAVEIRLRLLFRQFLQLAEFQLM